MASVHVNCLIASVLCAVLCANAALINPKSFAIQPRIVGGSETKPDQFKYMVGIVAHTSVFQWFICGGAIISERHILSSASVVADYVREPQKLSAVLGSPSYGSDVKIAHFEKVILHTKFNSKHFLNDLAILKTKENIIFTEAIHSIPLPIADVPKGNGVIAVVSGWGLFKVRCEQFFCNSVKN